MKKVIIPLAEGFEELEAITIIDLLRRAEVNVTSVSMDHGSIVNPVKASRGTIVIADMTLDEAMQYEYDMLVLPGGLPGADNLNSDPRIHQLIKEMNEDKKYLAAICAAPKVFMQAQLLKNRNFTCYPGSINIEDNQQDLLYNSQYQETAVVRDQHIITSKGPGTAMIFALKLIEILGSPETAEKVSQGLLFSKA